jgi:putative Mn2+ efflux pump MntP
MEQHFYILFIAIALGCDAFSVSLSIGSGKVFRGQAFRLGFHFGLFQFLMPLLGWGLGSTAVSWIAGWDSWIACGILSIVAIRIMIEALDKNVEKKEIDRSRGWYLVSLSIATSIDAFAVGLAFGVMKFTPIWPSVAIGFIAGLMSLLGLALGRKLRQVYGQAFEFIGGVLLLIIAFRFLYL